MLEATAGGARHFLNNNGVASSRFASRKKGASDNQRAFPDHQKGSPPIFHLHAFIGQDGVAG
jgi:hypothetical protein